MEAKGSPKKGEEQIHKLNSAWVFWYAPRGKEAPVTQNYSENLHKLGEFETLEGFFRNYSYIKRPADIGVDHKLMLFRKNCNPLWEEWPKGGCWILQFKKNETVLMNQKWELLLFSCIGEQLEESSNIIGVVISIRGKRNIMEIWMEDGKDEAKRIKIGEKIRACLDLDPHNLTFYYKQIESALQEHSLMRHAESYTFVRTPMETPASGPTKDSKEPGPFTLE